MRNVNKGESPPQIQSLCSTEGGRKLRRGESCLGSPSTTPPSCLECRAMCICHQQRSPHSSQTHYRWLPQVGVRVGEPQPAGVSISDPKLGRSHQELPAGAVSRQLHSGKGWQHLAGSEGLGPSPQPGHGTMSVTCCPHC